ncbi:hypothetical protein LRHMDP3_2584 [Lacticaseibacillus rhamnosus LRHMDP3]|uniref:Mobile element protein n=1 Tax=Lacticaseibacillus rhamnosus LRHMDP3 TaxID=1203259 RepID=A0AB33XRA2_LACRH|nr:hypothetical protein LRHMDP3_2584 [Lacticaseibacillus rhamnosus LRHMDP3]
MIHTPSFLRHEARYGKRIFHIHKATGLTVNTQRTPHQKFSAQLQS